MIRSLLLLCAVALPIFASSTPSERHLTLRRDGERLLILEDRTVIASAPAATTDRIVIAGEPDRNDTLTLDLSQPITLPGGIDYDGGARGFDSLELRGGSFAHQRVTQLTPHDGVIDLDGLVLRYTNLEPITDTAAAANYTINGTAGADTVTFSDGPAGTTTVSSPTFESVTFANKTNVVFDGMGGGDSVTFSNPNPATGLSSLIVRNVATVTQTAAILYPSFGVSATGTVGLGAIANDVDRIELATQNGDLVYLDADDLIVGGVDAALAGVHVASAGSIDLRLTDGSLTLSDTDGTAIVQSGSTAGNVFIRAPNVFNDLIVDVDRDAILAPAGTIEVIFGGSIGLGTVGPAFSNDVRAAGTVDLQASNLIIAGATRVASDDFGTASGADLTVRGFNFLEIGGTASVGAAGTAGADANVLTGGNGPLHLTGVNAAALFSTSGDVHITTWSLVIAPTSGITAAGRVTISTFIFGTQILLGPVTDSSALGPEISDAEIDRIFAPILHLTPDGNVHVTQPITFTTGTELILEPESGSFVGSGTGSLSAQTLTFEIFGGPSNNWTIDTSVLVLPGGAPIPFFGVTTLNANGGALNDVFSVTPHPTTTIHVDGELPTPPNSPGDTLDFDLTGVVSPVLTATLTPDGYQGTLTSSNRAPVEFEHIETLVDAPVDLQITKTDNATTDTPGTTITYTITVSNPTGIEVVGANVIDTFPAAITNVTWTCTPGPASGCTTAGNGNINDLPTLGPNSFVTYTATGTIDPSATGTLSNTASVTTPAGYQETNPANNTATDSTTLTAAAAPAGIPALSPAMLMLLSAALAGVALLMLKRP